MPVRRRFSPPFYAHKEPPFAAALSFRKNCPAMKKAAGCSPAARRMMQYRQ
jgi:hypothetical protein